MRAEANAASVPAWPPPTTMTSNCSVNSISEGTNFTRSVSRGTSLRPTVRLVPRGTRRRVAVQQRWLSGELLVHPAAARFQGLGQALAELAEKLVVRGELLFPRGRVDSRKLGVLRR